MTNPFLKIFGEREDQIEVETSTSKPMLLWRCRLHLSIQLDDEELGFDNWKESKWSVHCILGEPYHLLWIFLRYIFLGISNPLDLIAGNSGCWSCGSTRYREEERLSTESIEAVSAWSFWRRRRLTIVMEEWGWVGARLMIDKIRTLLVGKWRGRRRRRNTGSSLGIFNFPFYEFALKTSVRLEVEIDDPTAEMNP